MSLPNHLSQVHFGIIPGGRSFSAPSRFRINLWRLVQAAGAFPRGHTHFNARWLRRRATVHGPRAQSRLVPAWRLSRGPIVRTVLANPRSWIPRANKLAHLSPRSEYKKFQFALPTGNVTHESETIHQTKRHLYNKIAQRCTLMKWTLSFRMRQPCTACWRCGAAAVIGKKCIRCSAQN